MHNYNSTEWNIFQLECIAYFADKLSAINNFTKADKLSAIKNLQIYQGQLKNQIN